MTRSLRQRTWLPDDAARRIDDILGGLDGADDERLDRRLHDLVDRNREIHERDCVNLNPAANAMNPRAEALLAAGLGSRPSLGYAGAKYETGLEAVEEIGSSPPSWRRRCSARRTSRPASPPEPSPT